MKKRTLPFILLIFLCLSLSACTAKLTTIRPTLITRIAVVDTANGIKAEHLRKSDKDLDALMDDLVLQMEQQYKQTGACQDTGEQLYEVSFYQGEKLELHVFINRDGSVCTKGKSYARPADADKDISVDLEKWADFMSFETKQ